MPQNDPLFNRRNTEGDPSSTFRSGVEPKTGRVNSFLQEDAEVAEIAYRLRHAIAVDGGGEAAR